MVIRPIDQQGIKPFIATLLVAQLVPWLPRQIPEHPINGTIVVTPPYGLNTARGPGQVL